jgi:hypothetical protein
LNWGSPAIDSGNPSSPTDPDGTTSDIGAHPFDQSQFIYDYYLMQNYPNPFNAITKIDYELPKKSNVKINIYNILGQRVRTLVDKVIDKGYRNVFWDGKDNNGKVMSSGVYIYMLKVGDKVMTKKLTLIK